MPQKEIKEKIEDWKNRIPNIDFMNEVRKLEKFFKDREMEIGDTYLGHLALRNLELLFQQKQELMEKIEKMKELEEMAGEVKKSAKNKQQLKEI